MEEETIKGWILYKRSVEDSFETQRLLNSFKELDVDIEVVNPNDVDIFVNKANRQSILVNGETTKLPDFVLPRTGSGTTYFITAVIRHLERLGVTMINGSESINAVKDKLYTQQILAQSNLNTPKTMLLRHPIDLDFVEKNLGFPVIIKTLSGSFGAGVFLAESKKHFSQLVKMAEAIKTHHNIIVQEFIQDSFGKDLRVFVVNGKVVGCMMRQATDNDFRANISRGGEGIPYAVDEDIEWLASESAKLLDLDIAGVDLLFNNGSYTICEVNSAPGFEGMEAFTKVDVAKEIVDFTIKKCGK